jgi:hypothetical protein
MERTVGNYETTTTNNYNHDDNKDLFSLVLNLKEKNNNLESEFIKERNQRNKIIEGLQEENE